MQQDGFDAGFDYFVYVFFFEDGVAVEYLLVSLYRNDLAGVFIHEIFYPRLEYAGGQTAAYVFFESRLAHFHLFGKSENIENILVVLVTYGTQQGGER